MKIQEIDEKKLILKEKIFKSSDQLEKFWRNFHEKCELC